MDIIAKRLLEPAHRKFRPTDENALGFGNIFSDHMFKMDFFGDRWQNPRIEPYGPLQLDPAAMALHYGQLIFEGLKCFRRQDGTLVLFRPEANFKRFSRSAHKLCIPPLDEELALAALKELLLIDHAWVPKSPGTSLYIRPFIVATEPHLGVRPSKEYLFAIITGPVGAYYSEAFAPIKIYVEPTHSRTSPGGLGDVKAAANYAASLYAAEEAGKKGYDQLLWLDAGKHEYVEEVGSMNMFFVIDGEVVTSPLAGTVLPGIIRDSVLTVAQDLGYKVAERPISIEEILSKSQTGGVTEAFGAGTACVISPVGQLHYQGKDLVLGSGNVGEVTMRIYEELIGIQSGTKPDNHGWVTVLK